VWLAPRRLARLRQIESELEGAPPEQHVAIALEAAGEVFAAAGVSLLERDSAVVRVTARLPAGWRDRPELAESIAYELASALGTEERRRAVRKAVNELVEATRGELPLLARELNALLAEPISDSSRDDLVWVGAVIRSFGRE
jgi:hypothetical protein